MTPPQRELPLRAHAQILPAISCVKSSPDPTDWHRVGAMERFAVAEKETCPQPLKRHVPVPRPRCAALRPSTLRPAERTARGPSASGRHGAHVAAPVRSLKDAALYLGVVQALAALSGTRLVPVVRLGIEIAAWRSTSRDLPCAPSAETTEALRGVFFGAALVRAGRIFEGGPPEPRSCSYGIRGVALNAADTTRPRTRCLRRVACSDRAAVGVHPGQTSCPT